MPVEIHGKPYVTVNERVQEFHEKYPNGKIVTTIVDTNFEDSICMKSRVVPDMEHPDRYFTGYAWEKIGSSQINRTSFLENCETSAVGRANGCLGLGSIDSIATADEVANAIHQQKLKRISPEQRELFAEYIEHKLFDTLDVEGNLLRDITKDWWRGMTTEPQARVSLKSMKDRMDKYDAKKALQKAKKQEKELVNENK